jgi:hypothetical protein
MSNIPAFDPSIPVLTEVFQEPAPAADGAPAAAAIDWNALEKRLFERLMEQLHTQIEAGIERAVQQAVGELRPRVRAAVQDIVAQEVARLRDPAA